MITNRSLLVRLIEHHMALFEVDIEASRLFGESRGGIFGELYADFFGLIRDVVVPSGGWNKSEDEVSDWFSRVMHADVFFELSAGEIADELLAGPK